MAFLLALGVIVGGTLRGRTVPRCVFACLAVAFLEVVAYGLILWLIVIAVSTPT